MASVRRSRLTVRTTGFQARRILATPPLRRAWKPVVQTLVLVLVAVSARAAEVELLLDNLRAPVAVAVRPGPQIQVFVAERAEGRVLRYEPTNGQVTAVVDAIPAGQDLADASPVALAFLNEETLACVWGTWQKGGVAALTLYALQDEGPAALASLRLAGEEGLPSRDAPLMTLSVGEKYLYAASRERERGTVVRARHNSGMLGSFRTVARMEGRRPPAVCCSPHGYVVALCGGSLTFFDPGKPDSTPRASLAVGLDSVRALAYSPQPRPKERLLYALGNLSKQAGKQGVYRLDAAVDKRGVQFCRPQQVAAVEGAVSMAFAPDGKLYVVTQPVGSMAGRLYVIQGEL